MPLHIIPKPKIVYLTTSRSDEEIASALYRLYGKRKAFKVLVGHGDFVIEKRLGYSRGSTVLIQGHIEPAPLRPIRLKVSSLDDNAYYFAILWYSVTVAFFLSLIVISILNRSFSYGSLIIIPFVFVGYVFTTLWLKSAIDEAIEEVKRAVR